MERVPVIAEKTRVRRLRGRLVVLALVTVAVASLLGACSLDWVVIPKEAGPDTDGGAESRASFDDAAKLAT